MFVGSNGRVYQLDPDTGAVLNNLLVTDSVGAGDYTTRLVADDSQLYVGVHGYVYAIALDNWSRTAWATGVGSTGWNPVDLIVYGGRLFAGCHGYVYELDPSSGAVRNQLQLGSSIGVGDYTTRLATDGQNLYAGSHGYVYAVPFSNWQVFWDSGVGESGYHPVSVMCQGGSVYAGCNGYAYQIAQGQQVNSQLVTSSIGAGDYTTKLAADSQLLYVGVHGYVYGLSLTGKWSGTLWNIGVDGIGYNNVALMTQDGHLFAGSNGYVYDISPKDGSVLHSLLLGSMTGTGNYETTLAGDGRSLYPGSHGYSYKVMTLSSVGGAPLGLIGVSADPDGSAQMVVVNSTRRLLHTLRTPSGAWPYGWGDVLDAVKDPIDAVRWANVSADGEGNLDVLALDAENTLWHTIRQSDGAWPYPWGNVQLAMQGNAFPSIGPTPLVASATDSEGNLHVLALDMQNTLWHTYRKDGGSWPQPWLNVQAAMKDNSFPSVGPPRSVSASADSSGTVHLVAISEEFGLWLTQRSPAGTWQAPWQDVSDQVQPVIGPVRMAACGAMSDGSPQIAVVAATGTLWHTIRGNSGSWSYPWGNVQGAVAANGSPEIGPTPEVAASTDPTGQLHLVVLDAVDQAWYTKRAPSGSWSAWTHIEAPPG